MAAKKKASPLVHTDEAATMLTFANPPQADGSAVVEECSRSGFATIGIAIHGPGDVIDFSNFNTQSCTDLADAIELCVKNKGFKLPSMGSIFSMMQVKGVQITFENFVKALTKLLKPQA